MNPRNSRTKRKGDVSRKVVEGADPQSASSPCCGRFQFTEGFLLDTDTGDLWQFNQAASALFAVPRVDTADAGQADKQLIMERLQKAVDARQEMLKSISDLFTR